MDEGMKCGLPDETVPRTMRKIWMDENHMEKEILSIDFDEESGTTDVMIRVPDFNNFGQRLNELEQLAFEADFDGSDPESTPEGERQKIAAVSDASQRRLQEKINSMPDGQEKKSLLIVQENILKMKAMIESGDEVEDDLEEEDSDEDGEEGEPRSVRWTGS